jgi:hypothetical protein
MEVDHDHEMSEVADELDNLESQETSNHDDVQDSQLSAVTNRMDDLSKTTEELVDNQRDLNQNLQIIAQAKAAQVHPTTSTTTSTTDNTQETDSIPLGNGEVSVHTEGTVHTDAIEKATSS